MSVKTVIIDTSARQLIAVKAMRRRSTDDEGLPAFLPSAVTVNREHPQRRSADAQRDRRLRRDIALVLAIKTLAIVLLWLMFVRPQGVTVDSHRAGTSVLGATSPSTVSTPEPTP